jgi:SagB-type dehydrogenase family enzyme
LLLSLPEGVSISPRPEGGLVLHRGDDCTPVETETTGLAAAIRHLQPPGAGAADLAELIRRVDKAEEAARWSSLLETLARRGLLICFACQGSQRLACLVPTSRDFTLDLRPIELGRTYVLSRFAYSRRDGDAIVLESPLSHARILLLSSSAAVLVHALARPSRAQDMARQIPGMTVAAAAGLMTLLRGSGMLSESREGGLSAEDETPALRCWEFHDLLFHARSRLGRHGRPVGGTYRFAGQVDPPPVLQAPRHGEAIALDRPDLERLEREDPPLAAVQEARQSIRAYGARPLSARQLGEFLYRVGRVADYREARVETRAGPIRMAFAPRPYPAAGCLHELELYVAVNACAGLAPGLYSHDPEEHRLIRLSGRTESLDALLAGAGRCAGIEASSIQVQIILASRFARLAWKYESIAYALTLKNVGVLFQTMYLAATAMNLAPCALGVGDSDAFARAAGLDDFIETAVGEFLLGSKP